MRYIVKTTWWLKLLFPPSVTWKIKTAHKEVYLTFDDGPHPVITPFVLDLLRKYNAKGTFFCIGNNVKEYPNIFNQIKEEGHRVGNHTFDHLNGWKTPDKLYLQNIAIANKLIDSNLFRPPYGKISRLQANALKATYRIIMWDVLSADFDEKISPEKCLKNVVKHIEPGSIIVFHDSEKAYPRMKEALPKVLQYLTDNGYSMNIIP